MKQKMPTLFIGHGSPMNAIEDNPYPRAWNELGKRLPRTKTILNGAHEDELSVYREVEQAEEEQSEQGV